MVGCAAINCTNRSENCRMFRFPADEQRRAKWVQNMQRDKFTPSSGTRLCESHFEKSQYEQHRQDGFKKLKPNAIPTLFDVPNKPSKIDASPRKSVYKRNKTNESFNSTEDGSVLNKLKDFVQNIDEHSTDLPALLSEVIETQFNENASKTNDEPNVTEYSVPFSETKSDVRILLLEQEVEKWKSKYELLFEFVIQNFKGLKQGLKQQIVERIEGPF